MRTGTVATARVAVQLEGAQLEEFQRVARMLIRHPLITLTSPTPDALVAVRRWEEVLRNEFRRVLGYRLDVGRTNARLSRIPAEPSRTRGAFTKTKRTLGPMACSFLCLALAAAETAGDQITTSYLAQEVKRLCAGDDALPVDFTLYDHRKSFADALEWLADRGVLTLCDGDTDDWVTNADSGDALYDIDQDIMSRLLMSPASFYRNASEPADLLSESPAVSPEAELTRIRHRIQRRLLNDPVVSFVDLSDAELAYLRKNPRRIMNDLEQLTGATVQYHREAMVLVTDKELTGEQFPAGGSIAQAALLWGAALVDECDRLDTRRMSGPPEPWFDVHGDAALRTWADIVSRYRPRFSKEFQDNPEALRSEAEKMLSRFGLVRRNDSGALQIHVALAPFRPDEENVALPVAVQDDLFGGPS